MQETVSNPIYLSNLLLSSYFTAPAQYKLDQRLWALNMATEGIHIFSKVAGSLDKGSHPVQALVFNRSHNCPQ